MSKEQQTGFGGFNLVETLIKAWLDDRPLMKEHNSNPLTLLRLLSGEIQETIKAVEQTGRDSDITKQEIADIGIFLFSYCTLFNIDLQAEMMEKLAFNYLRFPAINFQDDGHNFYAGSRRYGKDREEEVKKEFYK